MANRAAGKKTTAKKKADERKYLCPYCDTEKKKSEFYTSSDPLVMTGITVMCKDCARKIAMQWNERTQTYGKVTKASLQEALERLDKPFLNNLWDSSYFECFDDTKEKQRTTIWDAYIKNIGLPQYRAMRWRDGDLFNVYVEDAKKAAQIEMQQEENAQFLANSHEINDEFEKNKRDVVRLLGYDPFAFESTDDQPLLYSQLIGYLDAGGDGNDDMMRTSSAITIVRGFLQQAKLDDKIAKAMMNTTSSANVGEIKTLLDAKKNISATISQLAEQSCLSLKHNKNASKGENTWTGKIKKLKDIDLRDAEVNGFDIGTCRGMQQVLEISDASILKQLALDESEWSDMVAEQRKTIVDLQAKRDTYREINRILLRENLDLRDTLEENGLLDTENLHDLKELFSPFSETVTQDSEEEENDAEE